MNSPSTYLFLLFLVAITNCFALKCYNHELKWHYPNADSKWVAFKSKYSKVYKNKDDECKRYEIWYGNSKVINSHNTRYAIDPTVTYKMGMNEHGDKTLKEIINMYLGGFAPHYDSSSQDLKEPYWSKPGHGLPQKYDARKQGCNIPPEDQQPCGSCYAFAAIASIECRKQIERKHHNIRTPFPRLSVQYALDCISRENYRVYGCGGGWPQEMFLYFTSNNSLPFPPAVCAPYKGKDTYKSQATKAMCSNVNSEVRICTAKRGGMKYRLRGYEVYENEDEFHIMKKLYREGAGVAGFAVLPQDFRWYKSGVYSNKNCTHFRMNHAVGLWGYGNARYTTGGKSRSIRYWLAKNSFGTSWGENGYFKISRNNAKNCRFENFIAFPKVV